MSERNFKVLIAHFCKTRKIRNSHYIQTNYCGFYFGKGHWKTSAETEFFGSEVLFSLNP
jgi:hypothetical protein